jgi:NADH:ubiquinone oxidoreductase subunit 2 (subunit N)
MYQFLFLALLATILSCFYYLKIVKIIYFNKIKNWNYYSQINFIPAFFISLFIILQFLFFINPSWIIVFFKYNIYSFI